MKKGLLVLVAALFCLSFYADYADARAGRGSRGGFSSYGSRGSRTYTAPTRPSSPATGQSAQRQATQPQSPAAAPMPQSAGGGFMRSLAGGLVGGMIGGLLFSSLGFAGGHGAGMGGIGIFDILLIGLVIFLIVKFMRSRQQAAVAAPYGGRTYNQDFGIPQRDIKPEYNSIPAEFKPVENDLGRGLSGIKKINHAFDEDSFKEAATDIFFRLQSAWTNSDLGPVRSYLAPEISKPLSDDLAELRKQGRINRMENIAMREMDITEAWQEEGKDYITVKLVANVLDYITDESGKVLEGSKTEPVRFVEYWTFVSAIGEGNWKLSAIQQDN
ncbi:MAG: TIM44-like domain-containing protein [Deltaproteobacteria bacterium]|nr:TIM44-like domain-containing protein [Deltaproteobacteria bacterium]